MERERDSTLLVLYHNLALKTFTNGSAFGQQAYELPVRYSKWFKQMMSCCKGRVGEGEKKVKKKGKGKEVSVRVREERALQLESIRKFMLHLAKTSSRSCQSLRCTERKDFVTIITIITRILITIFMIIFSSAEHDFGV